MTRWEYRIVDLLAFHSGNEKQLNELGAEGWEVFAVFGNAAYLKREVPTTFTLRSEWTGPGWRPRDSVSDPAP